MAKKRSKKGGIGKTLLIGGAVAVGVLFVVPVILNKLRPTGSTNLDPGEQTLLPFESVAVPSRVVRM